MENINIKIEADGNIVIEGKANNEIKCKELTYNIISALFPKSYNSYSIKQEVKINKISILNDDNEDY